MPTLAEGLHVVVKPCDLRRSLLFREIAILAVPRSPCLQNILLMTVQASSMPPRRPWPSRRRYCPGPRRAAIISGPTGGRRCPRYGALLKRGLGVRSSWPRSGSFNGLPRPDVARELPFKKPIQRRGDVLFRWGGAVICYFAAPPPPSATGPLPGALLGAPRGGFRVPAGGRWRYNRRCSVRYGTPAVERSAVWLGPHAIAGEIARKAVWP